MGNSNSGRIKKEATEALEVVKNTVPVRMSGLTILVPQAEINRLVREYVIQGLNEGVQA